jgi:hypothetical protein
MKRFLVHKPLKEEAKDPSSSKAAKLYEINTETIAGVAVPLGSQPVVAET